jgi:serine/threonine protein kinase
VSLRPSADSVHSGNAGVGGIEKENETVHRGVGCNLLQHLVTLAPGARLGHYEVLTLIGHGGMGEVYRARDPRLGRDVAIKILPPAFYADEERVRRFEHEIRAVAALQHPHICALYDVGHEGDIERLGLPD